MAPTVQLLFAFTIIIHPCGGSHDVAQPGDEFYERYRPRYHFIARKGWQNDATGPFYEPVTDTYHMFYQLNPFGATWGNMTWGHAISKDQVTWEDLPDALKPDNQWDHEGVFSGSTVLNAIDGLPTIFYTGASYLPINARLPYAGKPEHVMYATSSDRGMSWTKSPDPLLENPPEGMSVVGWRDPFVFQSVYLDRYFGSINGTTGTNSLSHYLIVSGGLRGAGGRIFLYQSRDYRDWLFKGFLFAADGNYSSFSPHSSNLGINFEMTQYLELPDPVSRELISVMIVGVEGNRPPDSKKTGQVLWLTGTIGNGTTVEGGQSLLEPDMVGVIDAGLWYGSNVYMDKTGETIAIGWVTEDTGKSGFEGNDRNPQGWSGMLSLPREISIVTLKDVHDPDNDLNKPGPWQVTGTKTLGQYESVKTFRTLGVKPLENIAQLRASQDGIVFNMTLSPYPLMVLLPYPYGDLRPHAFKSFELLAVVRNIPKHSQFGFRLLSSADGRQYTCVFYDDAAEAIVVDKSQGTDSKCLPSAPDLTEDRAYFKLHQLVRSAISGSNATNNNNNNKYHLVKESLKLHVFVDVSIIEVYANDRLAMTSRIYPCGTADGISVFASEPGAIVDELRMWPSMLPAWPKRAAASASADSVSSSSGTGSGVTSGANSFIYTTRNNCAAMILVMICVCLTYRFEKGYA